MKFDKRLNYGNPNLFLDLLDIRREKNMDSTIIFVGERRSGKSLAAIRTAEKLMEKVGKKFDVRRNLFFEPLGFLKRFQELEGEAIILDEASVSMDNRLWWDVSNRVINSVILREGFKRNWIIFTLPNLSDLDKRAVRLCSHLVTMFGHNESKQQSYGMAYRLKSLSIAGRSFPKKIQFIPFTLPTTDNMNRYLKMKVDWNAKVSKENIEFMEDQTDKDRGEKLLGKDHYINALIRGKCTEEYFRKQMKRLGIGKTDIDMLVEFSKNDTDLTPKTQEEIDDEEYMNEKQKLDIQLMEEKIKQEKIKTGILQAEEQKKLEEIEKIIEDKK